MSSKSKKNAATGSAKAEGLDIKLDAKLGAARHEPEFFPLPSNEFVQPVPVTGNEQEPQSTELHDAEIYETDVGGAKPDEAAMLIPDESEDPADHTLAEMAADSVRSFYTFINLAALLIVTLGIALTFLLIRESEMYGADNIQLSAETFLDGSFTASLSSKYINDMKLDTVIQKLANAAQYAYGFGADTSLKPVIPNSQGNIDDDPYITATTTTWRSEETTASSVSQSASASVNDSFTGTPVTMPTVTFEVESDFTGLVKRTTTSTTSLTTTAPYSHTATATTSPSETTAPPLQTDPTETSSEPTETTASSETDVSPSETTEPTETPTVTEEPQITAEE